MAHLIIGNGLPKIIDVVASLGGAGVHMIWSVLIISEECIEL